MSDLVIGIVLAAALMHAIWHSLIKGSGEKFLTYALINVVAMVVAIIGLTLVPGIQSVSYGWLGASIAVHHAYKIMLVRSYQFGDISAVFPIARGTAPVVVAIVSLVYLGERLTSEQLGGIILISVGVAAMSLVSIRDHPTTMRGMFFAAATGLTTAAYTLIDAHGARLSGSPIAYVCWIYVADGILFPLIALFWRRAEIGQFLRIHWWRGVGAGVLSIASYGAVVWAMTLGAIGVIAALREASVLFATLIGVWYLRERVGAARLLSSGTILLGILLVAAFR
jgi:drug/metabolite transporter (DMT)-like permease